MYGSANKEIRVMEEGVIKKVKLLYINP